MLERLFQLNAHATSVRTELFAGLTTFLTMAYITFVNPSILAETGMDFDAVFVATCVAAAFGSLVMGLYANYPIALAPGMELNAFFTYSVVLGDGHDWRAALGAVFLSGILFVTLSVLPVRQWLINAIPKTLKLAIGAGIGLFLGIIALNNAGIVVAHPVTLVTMGDIRAPGPILALFGFVLIAGLTVRRVPGAVLIGILVTMALGIIAGISEFQGLVSMPPDPTPTFLQLDIMGALKISMLAVIFTFLFTDLFDTAGTLIGVAQQADLLDDQGRLPRIERALLADSTATLAGAVVGTSSTTSYIESAAGTNAGGRTGLTAVTVAVLFLACLFIAPLARSVPNYATAPALLFVACLMTRGLAAIDWREVTEYVPAVVTVLAMPLTYSIADGMGLGFISYAGVKLLSGRYADCSPAVSLIAVLFLLNFAFL